VLQWHCAYNGSTDLLDLQHCTIHGVTPMGQRNRSDCMVSGEDRRETGPLLDWRRSRILTCTSGCPRCRRLDYCPSRAWRVMNVFKARAVVNGEPIREGAPGRRSAGLRVSR
jgi:hypothetical protein